LPAGHGYVMATRQRPLYERQVVDAGDITARLVGIGGDHTLSYPMIKGDDLLPAGLRGLPIVGADVVEIAHAKSG